MSGRALGVVVAQLATALLAGLRPDVCLAALTSVQVTLSAQAASPDAQPPSDSHDGHLFVFLSQGAGEPKNSLDWFRPQPFFRLDVQNFRPGDTQVLDDQSAGFPGPMSAVPPGVYAAQAVLHEDFYSSDPGAGAGNWYSEPQQITITGDATQTVSLTLTQRIAAPQWPQHPWLHHFQVKSEMLSDFHHRDVLMEGAVITPPEYDQEPQRHFPVLFVFPGFGGTSLDAVRRASQPAPAAEDEVPFIRVYLGGNTIWGHHTFADSATNGPRGAAFVEEFIPALDAQFRTVADSDARFLTGHSSGGWTSLWLQVTYPDSFAGVWSIAPDPVDFRDFQQIDLYADPPQNMYVDPQGNRRPLARIAGFPVLWYDDFARMDDTLGRGGQLRSFEAVFSPLDEHGQPQRLWNRDSGAIDPEVAAAWKQYDIRLLLQQNWQQLAPRLAGKLHIITGAEDTFYLEGAVEKLAETLDELGSDAVVEVVPGRDHGSIMTPQLQQRVRREMAASYRRSHPE